MRSPARRTHQPSCQRPSQANRPFHRPLDAVLDLTSANSACVPQLGWSEGGDRRGETELRTCNYQGARSRGQERGAGRFSAIQSGGSRDT